MTSWFFLNSIIASLDRANNFNKNSKNEDIKVEYIIFGNWYSILREPLFSVLNKLYLSSNNISDIKVLEKVKFEKLEELNLSTNDISDINILEKVNFKELKKLYLCYNNIRKSWIWKIRNIKIR